MVEEDQHNDLYNFSYDDNNTIDKDSVKVLKGVGRVDACNGQEYCKDFCNDIINCNGQC